MQLSALAVKTAQPRTKPYKLFDEKGLFLIVRPNGARWWRLRYIHAGKEKGLSLGTYPEVSLQAARMARDKCREQVRNGVDPSAVRAISRTSAVDQLKDAFEGIATEWFAKRVGDWSESHSTKIMGRLRADVFPYIGQSSIAEITPPMILSVLDRIQKRGRLETAHRVHQNLGQIFRYAVATGRVGNDPSRDLKGALAPWKPKRYATIVEPNQIGDLLRSIDGHNGSAITVAALKLAPMLFVRPGELRRAEWYEISFDDATWRLPAEKMKARVPHVVPLSTQALAILKEVKLLSEHSIYVFPSVRSVKEPMSENTLNAALRRLGYTKEQFTAHGFRAMASTLLNEGQWDKDAIELQLAHGERNKVRAAYNHAEKLPIRRKMMQWWADELDCMRGSK